MLHNKLATGLAGVCGMTLLHTLQSSSPEHSSSALAWSFLACRPWKRPQGPNVVPLLLWMGLERFKYQLWVSFFSWFYFFSPSSFILAEHQRRRMHVIFVLSLKSSTCPQLSSEHHARLYNACPEDTFSSILFVLKHPCLPHGHHGWVRIGYQSRSF